MSAFASSAAARALRPLSHRVVAVSRRRREIVATGLGDRIRVRRTPLTAAAGTYALWYGDQRADQALVGTIVADDGHTITRLIERGKVPEGEFRADWTGHLAASPDELGECESVAVPLRDGGTAEAWLFAGTKNPDRWAIHIQGIRTSRLVTLRSVEAARRAGLTSLVITYRGAGDGPAQLASTLGQREWMDVADAVQFARARGASEVALIGWSMGAGIALETARQTGAIDSLALICPATNWRRIITHGVRRARLPKIIGRGVQWALSSPSASRATGLAEPLDFDRLDWSRPGAVNIPTLVIHSMGDDEIPGELSREFAAAHPDFVTLVETQPAPHGWEANVDPLTFYGALEGWLVKSSD